MKPKHVVFDDIDDSDELLGVHIADVAYFVERGTRLDHEACDRGTTVYLPDRRLDMFPSELSEDLCSLRADSERFAMSVLVRYRPTTRSNDGSDTKAPKQRERRLATGGAIVWPAPPGYTAEVWFGRSLIRSRRAFAYEEAQALADNTKAKSDAARDLRALLALSRRLRQVRIDAGALELESAEPRFTLDPQTGAPLALEDDKPLEMKQVVAELMITANW